MRASIFATEISYYAATQLWVRETIVTVTDLDTGKIYSKHNGVISFMILALNLDKPIEEAYRKGYTWNALNVYIENIKIKNIDVSELFRIAPPAQSQRTLKRFSSFTTNNIRRSLYDFFIKNPVELRYYWKFIKHDEYLNKRLAPLYVESKL